MPTNESSTYFWEWDDTYPDGATDFVYNGDDEIRQIKGNMQNSFPNINAVVTATAATLNDAATLTYVDSRVDPNTTNIATNTANIATNTANIATNTADIAALDVGGFTPVGGIILYNAAFSAIPANWQLCNGTNGTPDMTDRFVYGTNTEVELLNTGGSNDAIVVAHTHTGTTNTTGSHTHKVPTGNTSGNADTIVDEGDNPNATNVFTGSAGNHSHTLNVDSTGSSGTDANMPQYLKLAYIQRMS